MVKYIAAWTKSSSRLDVKACWNNGESTVLLIAQVMLQLAQPGITSIDCFSSSSAIAMVTLWFALTFFGAS